MKTLRLLSLLPAAALLLWTASVAIAAPAAYQYLSATQPDLLHFLPSPPAAGSAEDKADLENTYAVHRTAAAADLARAADENTLTVFHFAPVIGPWFRPGKLPLTEKLFKAIEGDAKKSVDDAKKFWHRPRPYHLAPARFPHAIENEDMKHYSYPSGHSTRGTLFALVLAELFPDKREALQAKGQDTGWLRIVGGVHYASDVYAGRMAGRLLADELLRQPGFQRDLAAVRAELTAAKP